MRRSTVANPDPVPPADAKPAWLPRLQYAMAGLFTAGAVVTGLSGYSAFVIVAFAIDLGIVIWLMQQPWAKAMLRRN
jgi:hypothetical protein